MFLPVYILQHEFPPPPGGEPGKIGLESGTVLLAGDISVSIGSVECYQFADCSIHGKGSSCPAQVMPGIAMTIGNGKCNARLGTGRSAPESICIFAGSVNPDMGCPGSAAAKCPAKAGIGGAGELFR